MQLFSILWMALRISMRVLICESSDEAPLGARSLVEQDRPLGRPARAYSVRSRLQRASQSVRMACELLAASVWRFSRFHSVRSASSSLWMLTLHSPVSHHPYPFSLFFFSSVNSKKFPPPSYAFSGTIFGVYKVEGEPSVKSVLKPGREMVVAGYCMYGSSSNLVISTGKGVNGYTLDNVSSFASITSIRYNVVSHSCADCFCLLTFFVRIGHRRVHPYPS